MVFDYVAGMLSLTFSQFQLFVLIKASVEDLDSHRCVVVKGMRALISHYQTRVGLCHCPAEVSKTLRVELILQHFLCPLVSEVIFGKVFISDSPYRLGKDYKFFRKIFI